MPSFSRQEYFFLFADGARHRELPSGDSFHFFVGEASFFPKILDFTFCVLPLPWILRFRPLEYLQESTNHGGGFFFLVEVSSASSFSMRPDSACAAFFLCRRFFFLRLPFTSGCDCCPESFEVFFPASFFS